MSLELATGRTLESLCVESRDGSVVDVEGGEASEVDVEVVDGSRVRLTGRGTTMDLVVDDGSSADVDDYPVDELDFTLRDGSSADVWVEERARGSLRDGASLSVWGDGEVEANVDDGSSLRRR